VQRYPGFLRFDDGAGHAGTLMGSLTDRIGPRLVLVIASILSASGYALLYLTNSIGNSSCFTL